MGREGQAARRRRTHSPAFKAQVLQACSQPGVSIAAVALTNGLNANLVRRWLNARDLGGALAVHAALPVASPDAGTYFPRSINTISPCLAARPTHPLRG